MYIYLVIDVSARVCLRAWLNVVWCNKNQSDAQESVLTTTAAGINTARQSAVHQTCIQMLTWGQKSNLKKNALRTQHFSRISGNQVRLPHVGKRCSTFRKTFCNTRGNCGHSSGFNTPGGAVPPAGSPCWPARAWHRLLGLYDIYVAWRTHNHKVHVFVYCSALTLFYEWCESPV